MKWWQLGVVVNGVLLVVYLVIAWTVLAAVAREGQWRQNPLALATGLIFLSCGVGHGLHAEHLLQATFTDSASAQAARAAHDWHLGLWDLGTATIGVWYFTLRSRFRALVRGSALFEDLRERQRQALDIHDNVVQGLATAKLALEVGDRERAEATIEATLAASRTIITGLLGDDLASTATLTPGGLRRLRAASNAPAATEPAVTLVTEQRERSHGVTDPLSDEPVTTPAASAP